MGKGVYCILQLLWLSPIKCFCLPGHFAPCRYGLMKIESEEPGLTKQKKYSPLHCNVVETVDTREGNHGAAHARDEPIRAIIVDML